MTPHFNNDSTLNNDLTFLKDYPTFLIITPHLIMTPHFNNDPTLCYYVCPEFTINTVNFFTIRATAHTASRVMLVCVSWFNYRYWLFSTISAIALEASGVVFVCVLI